MSSEERKIGEGERKRMRERGGKKRANKGEMRGGERERHQWLDRRLLLLLAALTCPVGTTS